MEQKRALSAVDRAIGRLAADAHGVFTGAQLRDSGVGPTAITDRVRTGVLHRLHQGVYSTTPPRLLKVEARWMAAVLACGPDAVRAIPTPRPGGASGAHRQGAVHVSVPSQNGRRHRDGIVLHRCSTLLPRQTTVREFIPVTTPARTVSDLRRMLCKRQIAGVLRRAEQRRLDVGPQPEWAAGDPDQSELERRFLTLCRRHGLRPPEREQVVGAYTVDFLWHDARLVVEVDGYGTHGTRAAFEADRARDVALKLTGYEVVRFTWRQVVDDGPGVAAALRAVLGR